jgi:hypothetical protein
MSRRPVGVTILAVLSIVAGIGAAVHALQYFGIIPFVFGDLKFFGVNWLAGILWTLNTIVYFAVARALLNLEPWAWLFTVIIAGWNLIVAALGLIGGSSFGELALMIAVSAIILLYCLSPGVKQAFAGGGVVRA